MSKFILFLKNSKLSVYILIAIFLITLFFQIISSFYTIDDEFEKKISFFHEKGILKLDNQRKLLNHQLEIVKEYTNYMLYEFNKYKKYDKSEIENMLKAHIFQKIGIFQMRLLSDSGMELIRYNIYQGKITKAEKLQDKSNRSYYLESKNISFDDIYISKLDLNQEDQRIEIPHKHTIRTVKKIKIGKDIFYLVINYDLSKLLYTVFTTTLYDVFLIEKDNQINFHLNTNICFSKDRKLNIYLKDIIEDKNQYITKSDLNILPYKMVIMIKKSILDDLYIQKNISKNKTILTSIFISFMISLFLFILFKYFYKLVITKELEKRNKYINNILNSQTNFTLITDGKNLKQVNTTLLDFFGFNTLEEFHKKHNCICDSFINEANYLQKEQNGKTWLDILLEDINIVHKVKIKDLSNKEHIFQVNTSGKQIEEDYIITFTDITEIEKQSELLQKQSKLSAIGQLAAGITHEINTPLTYIKGLTEMTKYNIIDTPDNNLKKELLSDNQKIMDGLQRISIIIDSMREVSQQSIGKREKSNIYSTIVTVLIMIYNRSKQIAPIYINGKLFDIETFDKEEYQFMANIYKNGMEQVWIIILNNALDELLKIDDFNKRRIDINIIKNTDDSIKVNFIDNAGGISQDILPKIFEPFISDKESSGIGIGLNIAKKIVNEHDATIEAFNKNNGACFVIDNII